ncbi:alpha/beta fold hydrolase [Terrilactibacillus sp. BCM23-1]|uniref:Alpha/beta fold hydrolase n=1 Tax=Terrilactibacillus tamarindi TaxID=2599694 RepID=A0A6N8CRT1_9BACI|nr:alpha/beta hydrolase [Terrilactibacillus tamarindi]MTT31907.1 alpha/beta fold hydrolase [Terrilactibacillus tamarindi]
MPVLMIHGFNPDHHLMKGCMEPIFKKIAGYRRIYIDLPGMGKTTDCEKVNGSDDVLDVLIEFIHSVIPEGPFLIAGESYGGYLTRGIISKMKDRIRGAVFICPMIIPSMDERDLPSHTVIYEDHAFLQTLKQRQQDIFRTSNVVLDEYNWKRLKAEILDGCLLADKSVLKRLKSQYAFSFQVDEAIGSFDKPTLFLLGRQDSTVGYKDALGIEKRYTRATTVVLDRAGHNLQIEQSMLFEALVEEWLNRVDEDINHT